MRHGWRYLGLLPKYVLELTHKEFCMLCEENVERTYDEHEREAAYAIMHAAAYRGKGKNGALPSVTELFNRHNASKAAGTSNAQEDVMEQQRHAEEWLSQFNLDSLGKKED